jgi:cytochrome c biogenesis protein CcdA
MLTLGTMRVLQTHTGGSLGGNWNWVPYVAGLVVLVALIALAVSRINAKGSRL